MADRLSTLCKMQLLSQYSSRMKLLEKQILAVSGLSFRAMTDVCSVKIVLRRRERKKIWATGRGRMSVVWCLRCDASGLQFIASCGDSDWSEIKHNGEKSCCREDRRVNVVAHWHLWVASLLSTSESQIQGCPVGFWQRRLSLSLSSQRLPGRVSSLRCPVSRGAKSKVSTTLPQQPSTWPPPLIHSSCLGQDPHGGLSRHLPSAVVKYKFYFCSCVELSPSERTVFQTALISDGISENNMTTDAKLLVSEKCIILCSWLFKSWSCGFWVWIWKDQCNCKDKSVKINAFTFTEEKLEN